MCRTGLHQPLLARLVAALALVAALCGCAKARAEVEPDMPPLAVPPPPPRVLPPIEGEPIEAAAAVPSEPTARPRQQTRTRSDAGRSGANARAEAGSASSPADSTPVPPPVDEPTQPAPALQLAPPGDVASEQATRRQLTRAAQDLQKIDYRVLNTDGKAQYDTAKRFIALANQAIVDRNFLFARTLADKAATIAAVLQRR